MLAFEKPGRENTEAAAALAVKTAKERGFDLLMSTTRGLSLPVVMAEKEKQGFEGRIIAVTHAYGYLKPNTQEVPDEVRKQYEAQGVIFITSTHALSAGERGISGVFRGIYPLELVAHTLRMLGQGVKVAVEISLEAADWGIVREGKPVVCLTGTAGGEDTVTIITPAASNRLMEIKINEVLAKPSMYRQEEK